MAKLVSKIKRPTISMEASVALKELKETPFWGALRELMSEYIRLQKDISFSLNEEDPHFAVKHARNTGASSAFNFLIKYIEDEVKRESENG